MAADTNGNGRNVPTMWLVGALLTILLMVVGLYTASVSQRIGAAEVLAETTRQTVVSDGQRITRLEAQYDAISRSLERIEMKLDGDTARVDRTREVMP